MKRQSGIVAQVRQHVDDRVGLHRHGQLARTRSASTDRGARKRATIVCPKASSLPSSIPKPLALDRSGAADLLLQQQHAVDQRFRGRRAAGHVDVDRHDAVAAAHHRVGIVIVAAAIGAASPSRSRSAAPASGRRPCAAPAPSCWSACRRRSSRRTGAARRAARSRSARGRSAASTPASSRPRSRRGRRSSTSASRCAPS